MPQYSDINDEIINVWKDFPTDCGSKIPLLFTPSEDRCVLFISFNPYDISMLDTINVEQVIQQEIETQTQDTLPYFKPLKDIAGKLHLSWSHLDIFMLRETSQEKAKPKVLDNTNQFTRFGKKQFHLFTKALQKSTPKVIVVINALTSEIIKTQLRLKYNSDDGCYYAPDENINAPFFLGSMLSGQRALDIFSRERLIWHIQQKLRNIQ
jgi:hypothetical protein